LNIHREDEILYREAAKLIDKTLNKYRKWMPDLDSNKHWAMAALELAFNNVSNKDKNDTKPYVEKLEELTKELDSFISKK
jgi:cell division protein ZapA